MVHSANGELHETAANQKRILKMKVKRREENNEKKMFSIFGIFLWRIRIQKCNIS